MSCKLLSRRLILTRWACFFLLGTYLLTTAAWLLGDVRRLFPAVRDPNTLQRLQFYHLLGSCFLLAFGALAVALTIRNRRLRRQTHRALRETALGVSAIPGQAFCDSMCRHLSQALKMSHVMVGRFLHDPHPLIETVALYHDGRPSDALRFAADELPWGGDTGSNLCSYACRVRRLFPSSRLLQQFNAESCIAAVLRDSKGRPLGIMAACDGKPLADIEMVEALFKVFAVRAAMELERKQAEEELTEQSHLLQTIVDALPAPLFYKDARGIYLGCNRAFEDSLGQPRDRIIGHTVYEVAPADLAEIYHQADQTLMQQGGVQTYETSMVYADGTRHEVLFHKAVFAKSDGSLGGLVGTMVDITERKKAEETVNYLAHFDPRTNLPNPDLFQRRLALELAECQHRQGKLAVLNLDLDQFKKLTSTFGQQTGNELLRQVADRLSQNLHANDTVAKVGDDIFMVLLRIAEEDQAAEAAAELLASLRRPFILEGQETFITASIGIAFYPVDGADPESLIKSSTAALHRAKEAGRNGFRFHAPELTAHTREEIGLEYQLYKALDRGELLLYYQPVVQAQSNRIVGVEALLRWHHPDLGLLAPGRFIHLAEKTGLIVGIGDWVLRTACSQGRAWQDLGLPPLRMAVNLSPRQFQQPDLFRSVSQILLETGLKPNLLSIEITENILMQNVEKAVETLTSLKRLGVHLAIDDFGTGYSSLNYIKRFPFDMLKIDRSFVAEIPDHTDDLAIVSAVVAMARSLQLTVLAEGVENDRHLETLCAQGCHEFQGYLFSRPIPADKLQHLLFAQHHPLHSDVAAQGS